jgi:hypothetical protein
MHAGGFASADAPAHLLSSRTTAGVEPGGAPGNSSGMHRLAFIGFSAIALSFALAGLAGCTTGSTTYPPGTGLDGGYVVEPDGAVEPVDTGSPLPMSDGGPCMVATTVPSGQIPAYAAVVQQPNACSAAQISTFASSCVGSTPSASACSAFQTATANATCMGCLFPSSGGTATNTGGVLLDYSGKFIVGINTPGCIALADPGNGPACAADLEPLYQCETQACGSPDCRASTTSTYEACLSSTAAAAGACASQDNAALTACDSDFEDGGAGVGLCADDTSAINEICGTGM